ncbi:MAG: EAL domain-containing protein [Chloroflexi bacterium]|nr:EAL domain-containing protein [Chloroflexota bacterium]
MWQFGRWGGESYMLLVGGFVDVPLNLVGAGLAWRISVTGDLDHMTRRAWRFIGIGSVSYGMGNALWGYYESLLRVSPSPSLADVAYLGSFPLMMAGLVSFPLAFRTRGERARYWLDVCIVLVGSAMVLLHFVLPQMVAEGDDLAASILAYAYVVGCLVLLFGVITLLLRGYQGSSQRVMELLALSVGLILVADLFLAELFPERKYTGGDLLDVAWLTSELLIVAAAQLQYRGRAEIIVEPTAHAAGRPMAWLPYAAIAAGYGLLLVVSFTDAGTELYNLVIGAMALTALVVVRQVLAVRENGELLAEIEGRRVEARFRSLVQHASDAILVVDADTAIRYQTPSVATMFGFAPEDSLGARFLAWVHPDDAGHAQVLLAENAGHDPTATATEWRLRRRDGGWLHAEVIATNLLADPNVNGIVLTIRDIGERKALERQLTHQAFHDPLTGLSNRALFHNRVAHALARQERGGGDLIVLFLDLDDFKTVNDSLGHAAGDHLLVTLAGRLQTVVRTADTIARLGGDEFAILLEQPTSMAEAEEIAERIQSALRVPIPVEGHELLMNASIGIAAGRPGDGANELLRNADVAMYMVKTRGKAGWASFRPDMHEAAVQRLALKADLQRAVDQDEFDVFYQPTVAIATGQIIGAEALIRWRHPVRGTVSPAEFIPLAEETGLIVPIGLKVLATACQQARTWQQELPFGSRFKVNVNLSARQLHDPRLIEQVQAMLQETGIAPDSLVLEITESMLMQDIESAISRLQAIKRLGVRLAIDDFGTGYSSLAYLRRFPIDVLKIDRAFVKDLARGVTDVALTSAIVELGRALDLELVAEGIETADQRLHLMRMGCELGQGYLWSKPVPADEFNQLLMDGSFAAADLPRRPILLSSRRGNLVRP